jgi:hypothetical protein
LGASSIEAIARRVIELLDGQLSAVPDRAALIDVRELARRTGMSCTWIYAHAHELGVIRLGKGPKARLRFKPDTVERLITYAQPPPAQMRPATWRPHPTSRTTDVELLPIKRAYRAMSPRPLGSRTH